MKALKDGNYSNGIISVPFAAIGGESRRGISARHLVIETDEHTLNAETEFMLNFMKSKM